jgi:hypothetical protein
MSSSSVSALCRRIQQSYHFCLHLILSRWQSEQFRRQSLCGRQEQGKRAEHMIVSPHPAKDNANKMPKTPSVVSPYSIVLYPVLWL